MNNEARSEHETNTLYMPIIGGSDGGIFSCAADIIKVWQAVFSNCILSAGMGEQFLTPHVIIKKKNVAGWVFSFGRTGIKKRIILSAVILASITFQLISHGKKSLLLRSAIQK